ncbi:MAG: hypothetical protein ABSH46_20435 [Bryobacteraceae bacterium]|jgi:hypothetical protein
MRTARKKSARAAKRVAPADPGPQPPARWRLPSGQPLAEFALRSGLLARRLMAPVPKSAARRDRAGARAKEWTADSSPY